MPRSQQLANVFRKLLAEHSTLLSSVSAPVPTPPPVSKSHRVQDFKQFLDGFAEKCSATSKTEAKAREDEADEAKHNRPAFELLLAGHREALKRWKTAQKDKADDFNLMDVMGLTDKENAHSDVLAWLLDHDMFNFGTHAQDNLGFRLFLEAVGLPSEFADCEYRATRESSSDESRIDIEIAHPGKFVIYIENKIWANEGNDQTEREWRDLERRAEELGCPDNRFAFYLTPKGAKPSSKKFRPISWRKIAKVFDHFAADIKARTTVDGALTVALFATHYAAVLRRHIAPKTTNREKSDDAQHVQRSRNISAAKLGTSDRSRRNIGENSKKYTEAVDRILESIQEQYDGLDRCNNAAKKDGVIQIGRERWQHDGNYAYIGIECIDIDSMTPVTLANEHYDNPFVGIYTGTPKKPAMELEQIERLLSAANEILPKDKYHWEKQEQLSDYECAVWHYLPEGKELLGMLIDGDSQKFVDCLLGHFEVFAKFIHVLDEIFPEEPEK